MRHRVSVSVRGALFAVCVVIGCQFSNSAFGQSFIVKDARPRAEIVIAEKPPRMVGLAAKELRLFVKKITGAELPILNKPSGARLVKVYVGKSKFTERLGVTDEGLKYGAFRMVSGPNHLVLLGHDYDFVPREPYSHSRGDIPRAEKEWDKITGSTWLNPMHRLYKDYHRKFGIWRFDQGGSLNAVYDFLRSLGVRWYMPGELGEVLPKRKSISLPSVDKTVRPSFALRQLKWSNYAAISWEDLIWDRRMGINSGYEVWGAKTYKSHGMRAVIGRKEMQRAHPDYYALLGGVRDTKKNGTGTPCLRSEGLIRETVRYCRAVFDHFDEPMVCIWPTDGFKQCRCELCKDIESVSDYVWGFVDRVAQEVYKTHPDRRISCGAYASYVDPPTSIEKLSPNVVVYIANRGRPGFGDPERWKAYWATIEGWRQKVAPGNIIRGENNLYTYKMGGRAGPVSFPPLHPREYAKDLKALEGICMGERNEVPRGGSPHTWRFPGVDHLNLYVNARFLWDADQDIEAVLDEYYTLFYGPARDEMQAAFEFADANFPAPPDPKRPGRIPSFAVRVRFMEMLHAARKVAGDTVYGKRIQMIINELPPLDELRKLAFKEAHEPDPRAQAPLVVGHHLGGPKPLKAYRMKNLITGKKPDIRTTFKVGWDRGALCFEFHCEEPDMKNLYATDSVWDGDSVALVIETPVFAYYQIEISPEGKVYDAARNRSVGTAGWSAQAEVETERGDDWWRVRVRLPVSGEDGYEMDPNHNIAGAKPTDERPWFFNAGRCRLRDAKKTNFAFSPTGGSYHERDKFARLVIR